MQLTANNRLLSDAYQSALRASFGAAKTGTLACYASAEPGSRRILTTLEAISYGQHAIGSEERSRPAARK
jgi:hypothetical protein